MHFVFSILKLGIKIMALKDGVFNKNRTKALHKTQQLIHSVRMAQEH